MICNWCSLQLKQANSPDFNNIKIFECLCLPEFLPKSIKPQGVESTMCIFSNDDLTYYDVYHMIDDKFYNIEGAHGATSIIALQTDMTEICRMPFYTPTSANIIKELIELSHKIIKLKAFT